MPDDPIARMMDMSLGYCRSQGLGTVARLGVADFLKDGPKAISVIAAVTGAHEESLFRVMRALAVEGIFEWRDGDTFSLNEMAEGLRSDHPRSVRWFAAAMCDDAHWQPWGKAYDAVIEGKSQTQHVLGESPWEYLSGNPDQAGRFGLAMSNMSLQAIQAITENCDFGRFEHIVDVGGNHGTLLLGILAEHPEVRGTILDLPPVIEVARRELAGNPLAERISLEPGSFFNHVPTGADAYLLKHILHDWPDEQCLQILASIRKAIPDEGRLFIFEALLAPEAPGWAHWLDVHMFVLKDGKERSRDEFGTLLGRAGFEMVRGEPISAPVGILEAKPI